MTEAKTQPTDADVKEFLDAAIPAKRRDDGIALDLIFQEVTGTKPILWGPSIVGYGQYRFVSPRNPRTRGIWPKTGFSPRKASLSLYGLKDLPAGAALLPKLGTYTEGAGCVYVKKLEDIDLEVLRKLIYIAFSREDDPVPNSGSATSESSETDDELPKTSEPAKRAMAEVGITTVADLEGWTAEELLKLHGVGPKAVRMLREAGVEI